VGRGDAARSSRRNLISARGSIPMSAFFRIIDRILQCTLTPTSKIITKALWDIHFRGRNQGTLKYEPTRQCHFREHDAGPARASYLEAPGSRKARDALFLR
jgi:hypothetical protein